MTPRSDTGTQTNDEVDLDTEGQIKSGSIRQNSVDRNAYGRTTTTEKGAVPPTEPSLAELMTGLTSDFSTLVRKEAELARVETEQTINKAIRSAVMIITSGLVAYAGLLVVLAAVSIWLGALIDNLWLGTLIVGVIVLVVGLILYIMGRGRLDDISISPERTVQTLQDDTEWAKEKVDESI